MRAAAREVRSGDEVPNASHFALDCWKMLEASLYFALRLNTEIEKNKTLKDICQLAEKMSLHWTTSRCNIHSPATRRRLTCWQIYVKYEGRLAEAGILTRNLFRLTKLWGEVLFFGGSSLGSNSMPFDSPCFLFPHEASAFYATQVILVHRIICVALLIARMALSSTARKARSRTYTCEDLMTV